MLGLFQNKNKNNKLVEELKAVVQKLEKDVEDLKDIVVKGGADEEDASTVPNMPDTPIIKNAQEKIVEGVFDGYAMQGNDGNQYDVPANYASKSKLVQGDILKLTVSNTGSFIFKQIKPIERQRLIGNLEFDARDDQYYAEKDGKRWKLITASVTYFKGEEGDEVIFLIPEAGESQWAAVENILKL